MKKRLVSYLMAMCLAFGGSVLAEDVPLQAAYDFSGLEPYFDIVEMAFDNGRQMWEVGADYAIVREAGSTRMGVMDFAGSWEIEPSFSYIGLFSSGLAPAQKLEFGQYGYIDRKGRYVIAPQFSYADSFSDGVAVVETQGRYAYINTRGEILKLLEPGWIAQRFSSGVAWVYRRDTENGVTHYVLLDTQMREIYSTEQYIDISGFSEGYATASETADLVDGFANVHMLRLEDGHVTDLGNPFAEEGLQPVLGPFVDGYAVAMVNWQEFGVVDTGFSWVFPLDKEAYVQYIGAGVFLTTPAESSGTGKFVNAAGQQLGSYQGLVVSSGGYGSVAKGDFTEILALRDIQTETLYYFLPKHRQVSDSPLREPAGEIVLPQPEKIGTVAFRPGDERMVVNGSAVIMEDVYYEPSVIVDDHLMLPAIVLDTFIPGWRCQWYGDPARVVADGIEISMRQGSAEADITAFDTQEMAYAVRQAAVEVPAYAEERTIMIPMRFVFEALGWTVYWDSRGMALASDTVTDLSSMADDYWAVFGNRIFAPQDYPVIDGSTATIPMSSAMTAKLLGIGLEQAEQMTHHNKTVTSFENLISGQADVLLTVSPDEEITQKAAKAGVSFDVAPLAKEGFVFLVNKDNPVDSLTVEQIQGIYTGEITNWKEVGGDDAPIIPFQRNADSGSQTIMRNMVMKGLEMLPPDTYQVPTMMGLVDQVAEFDAAADSIGYSVYYYFTEMHNRDEVKLLKIDGVEPNEENIRSGTYPFVVEYAAVIRSSESEGSSARRIYHWLQGLEGQRLVQDTGFVAVGPSGD